LCDWGLAFIELGSVPGMGHSLSGWWNDVWGDPSTWQDGFDLLHETPPAGFLCFFQMRIALFALPREIFNRHNPHDPL
jgi:hypothetical protein